METRHPVKVLSVELYEEETEVFDIEVEQDHSFIVGGVVVHNSTLDSRTTLICQALSGLQWSLPDYEPIGHDQPYPGPTAHWGCRSTTVAVYKSFAELSKSKSVTTEAGGKSDVDAIFRRNLKEAGLTDEEIEKSVYNARASMDGQVASDLSFDDWLGSKSKAFQDEALGPGRADLWRDGDITLAQMIDQTNRPLTLDELSKK